MKNFNRRNSHGHPSLMSLPWLSPKSGPLGTSWKPQTDRDQEHRTSGMMAMRASAFSRLCSFISLRISCRISAGSDWNSSDSKSMSSRFWKSSWKNRSSTLKWSFRHLWSLFLGNNNNNNNDKYYIDRCISRVTSQNGLYLVLYH